MWVIRPDQTRPDQTRPDQTRPDQTRPDQNILFFIRLTLSYTLRQKVESVFVIVQGEGVRETSLVDDE